MKIFFCPHKFSFFPFDNNYCKNSLCCSYSCGWSPRFAQLSKGLQRIRLGVLMFSDSYFQCRLCIRRRERSILEKWRTIFWITKSFIYLYEGSPYFCDVIVIFGFLWFLTHSLQVTSLHDGTIKKLSLSWSDKSLYDVIIKKKLK